VAAEAKTEIRGNDNEGQEVECDGANRVFQRLAGRVDGVDEVQKAKVRVFVDEQDGGMQERNRESDVAGPMAMSIPRNRFSVTAPTAKSPT